MIISREGQDLRKILWPSGAGGKEESSTQWPGEIEMYHKVVGGECGLRFFFFFFFNHPVSPRLHAALLRRLMNAEAAQFVCQHAFVFVEKSIFFFFFLFFFDVVIRKGLFL